MKKITPFLLFDGNCAEAMTFYHSCLGGELRLTRIADTPMKDHMPQSMHQKVANAHLKNDHMEITATDWMHPVRKPRQGNTVCIYITCGKYEDLRQFFGKLSEDADKELLDELRDMPFGTYGHLADKYGVHWFFQSDEKSE
jgi:PhnB protein